MSDLSLASKGLYFTSWMILPPTRVKSDWVFGTAWRGPRPCRSQAGGDDDQQSHVSVLSDSARRCNYRSPMQLDYLNVLAAFLTVAEERSFTKRRNGWATRGPH
jgi:hypothetical protein